MMKSTATDSILAEVRAERDKHAAKFHYNVRAIFADIREQQAASGRKFVRYPARPVQTLQD